MNKLVTFFSLFGSVTTLLCCALPVTLVSLGMGASFAALTATFPQIIWLTGYKDLLFALTGLMLAISFFMIRISQKQPCPIDREQREMCERSKRISSRMFWLTILVYFVGFVFSYIAPLFI